MEVHADRDPPLILDAAHNPDGARALAEALAKVVGEREVVACIAVLADKDAAGIVGALAPRLAALVATEIPAVRLALGGRPGARSLPAVDLAKVATDAGIAEVATIADPAEAIARAQTLARDRQATLLVCGSHYLLSYT
jgi:dihydrofolate synthase/folylpolyglutamate synthase